VARRFRSWGHRPASSPPTTACAPPRRRAVSLLVILSALALPTAATAQPPERSYFFEETAEANWSVAHRCGDGSTVDARLLVSSTYDFESPDTEDEEPTVRVQYLAVCPDGTSYSWGRAGAPVSYTSTGNLKRVHVAGALTVRDIFGVTHDVTVDVSWTGHGGVETSVETSHGFGVAKTTRKERAATASGTVTFDGDVLVSGAANHFLTPFIRIDEESFRSKP